MQAIVTIGGRQFDITDERSTQPWDYIPEWDGKRMGRLWHTRFLMYRDLPPLARTIVGTYRSAREVRNAVTSSKPLAKESPPTTWWEHSARGFWQARAAAYDDWVRAKEEADAVEERKRLRKAINDNALNMSQKLQKYIDEAIPLVGSAMIKSQKRERRVPDPENPGTEMREVHEVLRIKSGANELAGALKTLYEIQRKVLGIPDEDVHTVKDGGKAIDEFGTMSWEDTVKTAEAERKLGVLKDRIGELEELISSNGLSLPAEE
jgi:hypothetical protein